jgi:hypothetical protein
VWITRVSFFLFGDSGLVSEGVWVGPFIYFSGWVFWVGVGSFQEFFWGGFWIGGRGDFGRSIFLFFFQDGWVGWGEGLHENFLLGIMEGDFGFSFWP